MFDRSSGLSLRGRGTDDALPEAPAPGRVSRPLHPRLSLAGANLTDPFRCSRAASCTCEAAAGAHSSPSHPLLIGGPGRPWTFFFTTCRPGQLGLGETRLGRVSPPHPRLSLADANLTDRIHCFGAASSTREVAVDAHSSPSHALLIAVPRRPWTFLPHDGIGPRIPRPGAHSWPSVSPSPRLSLAGEILTEPFSLFRAASSTSETAPEAHSSPSHALLIGGPGRPWTFFLCGVVDPRVWTQDTLAAERVALPHSVDGRRDLSASRARSGWPAHLVSGRTPSPALSGRPPALSRCRRPS